MEQAPQNQDTQGISNPEENVDFEQIKETERQLAHSIEELKKTLSVLQSERAKNDESLFSEIDTATKKARKAFFALLLAFPLGIASAFVHDHFSHEVSTAESEIIRTDSDVKHETVNPGYVSYGGIEAISKRISLATELQDVEELQEASSVATGIALLMTIVGILGIPANEIRNLIKRNNLRKSLS